MTIKQTPTISMKQLRILSKDEPLIRTVSTGHLLRDITNQKLIEHNQKTNNQ